MKRSVILLAMTCAEALAQQRPAPLTPQPEAWRLQAWKNALRGPHINLLQMSPPPKACAVPLLAVPVNPQVGAKMPVSKPPAEKLEDMPSAVGLPPCPRE
jgi:hypothetical protein